MMEFETKILKNFTGEPYLHCCFELLEDSRVFFIFLKDKRPICMMGEKESIQYGKCQSLRVG